MNWEIHTLQKQLEREQAVERNFTAFERAILVAYLDRSMAALPTYHPAKALKIFRRWPILIDRAFTLLRNGGLL